MRYTLEAGLHDGTILCGKCKVNKIGEMPLVVAYKGKAICRDCAEKHAKKLCSIWIWVINEYGLQLSEMEDEIKFLNHEIDSLEALLDGIDKALKPYTDKSYLGG